MTDDKTKDGDETVDAAAETVERDVTPGESEATGDSVADEVPASDANDTDTDTDADTDADTEAEADAPEKAARRLLAPLILLAVFVLSIGVSAFAYFAWYQPDRKIDDRVAASVLQSASDGAVALLSYSPDTLDQDFTNAKTRLTGDFLSYYTQFTQEIVTPAAKQKSVQTSAAVVRSALSKLEPSRAEVLLFINQSTVSKENPDGSFTASSVKVEMTKVADAWLISSFDPV